MIYFYDVAGKITRCMNIPSDEAVHNEMAGESFIESTLAVSDTDYYVDTTHLQMMTFPERPSDSHRWDWATKQWVFGDAELAAAKAVARERINTAWKAEEKAGFTAYGKVFDADDKAIQRVSVAAQAAMLAKAAGQDMAIDWTCADNSTIHLMVDQLIQMPIIMAQAATVLHGRCQVLKAQIDVATSLTEIEAITW